MGHTCCCKGFPDALQGLPWVAVGSLSAADDSAEDGTAAETRATGLGKQAIKELVDVDVALVERRLAACATQLRMAGPVTCSAAPNPPQTPGQGGAQASLSTASSMAKSAVPGPRLVRFMPGLSPLSHSSPLNIKAQMGSEDMRIAKWRHWRLPGHFEVDMHCSI